MTAEFCLSTEPVEIVDFLICCILRQAYPCKQDRRCRSGLWKHIAAEFRLRINNLGCLDALVVCLTPDRGWRRHLTELPGFVIAMSYRIRSESTRGRHIYGAIQIEGRNTPMMEKAIYIYKYNTPTSKAQTSCDKSILHWPTDIQRRM